MQQRLWSKLLPTIGGTGPHEPRYNWNQLNRTLLHHALDHFHEILQIKVICWQIDFAEYSQDKNVISHHH